MGKKFWVVVEVQLKTFSGMPLPYGSLGCNVYNLVNHKKNTVLYNGTFKFDSRSSAPIALALLQLLGIALSFRVRREEKP